MMRQLLTEPARARRNHEPPTALVADDEPLNIEIFTRLLGRLGFDVVSAPDGEIALQMMADAHPDLVLLDVDMPRLDGFDVCRSIKQNPSTRLTPVVLVTALSATQDRIHGIDAGADDFLTKPVVIAELEARIQSLMRVKAYTDGLDSADAVVLSLALTIEARDPYTHGHCERLATYATSLGRKLGLDEATCGILHRGGFLHDIGKIAIPDAILMKRGPLTPAEYARIQQHTTIGDGLCSQLRSLSDVRAIVRHHHERNDGSGYPDGLARDAIPLPAQIISLVDGYDAMTTDRPYKSRLSSEQAFTELWREVANGWKDAALMESFEAMIREREMLRARLP
jgi:putative two-component system response regulator